MKVGDVSAVETKVKETEGSAVESKVELYVTDSDIYP